MIPRSSSLIFILILSACSSGKKEEDYGGSFQRRIQSADPNKVSSYQKAFNTESAGGTGMSKLFGRKEVRGSDMAGLKSFKTGKFKTNDFSTENAGSPFGNDKAAMAGKKSSFGNNSFKTGAANLGTTKANEGTRTFSGADDQVRARSYMPGMKSLQKNQRPMVTIDPSAPKEKVAYTEEEIQRLLGR